MACARPKASKKRGSNDRNKKTKIIDCTDDFLAKYRLTFERYIGRGLCGKIALVFFTDDPMFKRVLKCLPRKSPEDRWTKMFLAEANALQNLDHPFILRNAMAFSCVDRYVLSMPYYPRGDLTQHLHEMSTARAMKHFLQMTCAVQYMHCRNMVHGDIKPENILLNTNDDVILIDFGLSRKVTKPFQILPKMIGTKGYIPPEMVTAPRYVNVYKLDTYAMGAVLWNLLFKTCLKEEQYYLMYVDRSKDINQMSRYLLQNLLHPELENRWNCHQLVDVIFSNPELGDLARSVRKGRN